MEFTKEHFNVPEIQHRAAAVVEQIRSYQGEEIVAHVHPLHNAVKALEDVCDPKHPRSRSKAWAHPYLFVDDRISAWCCWGSCLLASRPPRSEESTSDWVDDSLTLRSSNRPCPDAAKFWARQLAVCLLQWDVSHVNRLINKRLEQYRKEDMDAAESAEEEARVQAAAVAYQQSSHPLIVKLRSISEFGQFALTQQQAAVLAKEIGLHDGDIDTWGLILHDGVSERAPDFCLWSETLPDWCWWWIDCRDLDNPRKVPAPGHPGAGESFAMDEPLPGLRG